MARTKQVAPKISRNYGGKEMTAVMAMLKAPKKSTLPNIKKVHRRYRPGK